MASRMQLLVCLSVTCLCLCVCLSHAAPAPAPAPLPDEGVASACRCTREINMVCANDGKTYSNKCMLNCARATGASKMGSALKIVKMGECC